MRELLQKESKKITDFIFALGYFSEIIIAIIVIYLLQTDIINILVFIFFFLFSGYTNTILKSIIREPRPHDSTKYLYSEHFSRTKTIYGMPSGHSQNVFFSMTYLFLTSKEPIYWVQICLSMAALMVYERWTFHNHTLLQLGGGAIIGIILGFIVVYLRDNIRKILFINEKNKNKKE